MVNIHDYDIELIEAEILRTYNDNRDYSDYNCLLSLRKDMINKRVLTRQEEILQDIITFNDTLRDTLKEMYDRAHTIWNNIKDNAWGAVYDLQRSVFSALIIPNFIPYKARSGKNYG